VNHNPTRSPQLGAALALTQLLQEHPELSAAGWTVDPLSGSLSGFLYEESSQALEAYAEVLGGEVTQGLPYPFEERTVYPYRLSTTWRDVRVSVSATVPLAKLLGRAA